MSEGILSASSLTRAFHSGGSTVWAVSGVDLDVNAGELLAVTGRSGSGKTTLLNLLSGLDRPTGGSVLFRGEDLSRMSEKELVEFRRRKIGFVFQSFGLMPLLSAQENVELPLHIGGVSWRERRRRAQEVLESVGLGASSAAPSLRAVRRRTAARVHSPRPRNPAGSSLRRRTYRGTGHHHGPLHHRNLAENSR